MQPVALGWAVDDPAADLLASMSVGAPVGRRSGWSPPAAVAISVVAIVLMAVEIGPALPPGIGDRLPEGAAAGAGALAVGLLAVRRGERGAGPAAVATGVLSTAFLAALSVKLDQLPSFLPGPHHSRWWLVALVGLVVAVRAGRDPGRP